MGTIVKPTTFVDNTIPTASQFNGDFDTIYTEFNGAITNSNISASAAIATSKIDATFPSSAITGNSDTQTLTNKRITKRVGTITDSATPTPNADSHDIYAVTALAQAATIGAPTGTPTDGQGLILRIKDNGTARALNYNAIYRVIGTSLPTTTVISKTIYIGCLYNAADIKWDVVAAVQEA